MIETHKELLKLHGKKVTCKIQGEYIADAVISVGKAENVYICQNIFDGSDAEDKFGYKHSWAVSREIDPYEDCNRHCTEIELVEEKSESKIVTKGAMQEFNDLCQECRDILNAKLDSLPLKDVSSRLDKIKKALKDI